MVLWTSLKITPGIRLRQGYGGTMLRPGALEKSLSEKLMLLKLSSGL